jgi:hypothetical protein
MGDDRRELACLAGQLVEIERPGLPDLELTFTGCHRSRAHLLAYDAEGIRYYMKPTGIKNRFRLTSV